MVGCPESFIDSCKTQHIFLSAFLSRPMRTLLSLCNLGRYCTKFPFSDFGLEPSGEMPVTTPTFLVLFKI